MPVTVKIRIALLLLLILVFLAEARSADAPLRKSLLTPSQQSEVVRCRAPRPVSRQEIFQAIQNDLAQRGISGRGELQPGDLRIQSSVPALQDDVGLQVKRMGFDPIRRELVFELWASREPQYLPFDVTTRRSPRSLGLSSRPEWKWGEANGKSEAPATGAGVTPIRSKAPVLAKPGRPATLVMLGENVRITTTAVPLQPGSKGQIILVRESTTERVMSAEVVDEGLLETRF
jgi:hypothetical protein